VGEEEGGKVFDQFLVPLFRVVLANDGDGGALCGMLQILEVLLEFSGDQGNRFF
jgi:hypothetical protein